MNQLESSLSFAANLWKNLYMIEFLNLCVQLWEFRFYQNEEYTLIYMSFSKISKNSFFFFCFIVFTLISGIYLILRRYCLLVSFIFFYFSESQIISSYKYAIPLISLLSSYSAEQCVSFFLCANNKVHFSLHIFIFIFVFLIPTVFSQCYLLFSFIPL